MKKLAAWLRRTLESGTAQIAFGGAAFGLNLSIAALTSTSALTPINWFCCGVSFWIVISAGFMSYFIRSRNEVWDVVRQQEAMFSDLLSIKGSDIARDIAAHIREDHPDAGVVVTMGGPPVTRH